MNESVERTCDSRQALFFQVQIDRCRTDTSMPQQLLKDMDIGPLLKAMGCKTVAHAMK